MKLSPAQVVIKELGGVCKTARLLGVDKSTISKWQAPKAAHGTGGLIPSGWQERILHLAGQRITPTELIFGREYVEG